MLTKSYPSEYKLMSSSWTYFFSYFHVQVTGKELPHNPSWPMSLQLYVVLHFLLVLRMYHDLFENNAVCVHLTLTLFLSRLSVV